VDIDEIEEEKHGWKRASYEENVKDHLLENDDEDG
jgi:hypothetical protein